MRFGLALPHYGFSLPDGEVSFEAVAEWARLAESLGFDSVWVSDHLVYSFARYGADPAPIASLEPMTTVAALAAVTTRVRLGTLVLCAPFRHPSMVAKMASTIDGISNGRFELGVGAGWLEEEFRAFGFPFGTVDERFEALEQTLVVLEALRGGDAADVDAGGVHLRDARLLPPPVQRPLPVFVGGKGGRRLLRLAVRHADGWNVVWRISDDAFAERAARARRLCEEEGRDPGSFRFTVGLHGLLGETQREARAAFERGRAAMPGGALDAED
jgi:probable F420-dependent oxidoreductase